MTRTTNRISKSQEFVLLILAVLPAITLGFLISQNWVNVPKVDQWNTPGGMLIKIHEGKLTLDDWFSQHNENRFLVYRLVSIPLAFLTHWDVRYEIVLMFFIACGISLSFYRLIKLTLNHNERVKLFVIFAINLLIFSPIQTDVTGNLLFGIQLVLFLGILLIALCVLIAHSKFNFYVKFLSCATLSLVSTFTFSNGILCWIIVLPPLIILSISSWREILKLRNFLLLWFGFFALTFYIYFYFLDYQKPSLSSHLMDSLNHPFQAFLFFLSFLGAPLGFRNFLISQLVGLILILIYLAICFYLIRFRFDFILIQRAIGWLTFSFYSLLSGILITLGRFTVDVIGTPVSLYAKYTTPSLYFIISIIGLAFLVISHSRLIDPFSKCNKLLKPALIALVITGLIFHSISFVQGIKLMKEERLNLLTGKACLLLINVVKIDDCIAKHVYPLIQVGNWNSLDYVKDSLVIFNQMELFSPQLLTSSKIREINNDQHLSVDGVFENLLVDSSGMCFASGSLKIHQDQNIGGIVLAYGDPNDATIFAIADLVLAQPLHAMSTKADMFWQAQFPVTQLPTRPTQITAWAVNTDTGKLFKLQQSNPKFIVSSRPQ